MAHKFENVDGIASFMCGNTAYYQPSFKLDNSVSAPMPPAVKRDALEC